MVYAEFSDMCAAVGSRVVGVAVCGAGRRLDVYVEDVETRRTSEPAVAKSSGILLQRCGGGVRVLRKRIGGA